MHLIPATLELLNAELQGPANLSAYIGARVPDNWPPHLYDEGTIRWTMGKLSEPHAENKWYVHYFVLQSESTSPDIVIGAGGYVGPPDASGAVELGYSILPEYQRKGFATEATAGLTRNAFLKPQVKRVVAHTLEGDPASSGVLLKNGFVLVGPGVEAGVARYEVTKSQWKAFSARNPEPLPRI